MKRGGIFGRRHLSRQPTLAEYLAEPERFPTIAGRPYNTSPEPAVGDAPDLAAMFQPRPGLDAPTSYGGAFDPRQRAYSVSALALPSVDMSEPPAPPVEPQRGLEPQSYGGGLSLYDRDTAALRNARQRAPILIDRDRQAAEQERIRRNATLEGRLERIQGDLGQAWANVGDGLLNSGPARWIRAQSPDYAVAPHLRRADAARVQRRARRR